jgi:ABC-type glycerol-3-phosphate transport system substrate-binding protein
MVDFLASGCLIFRQISRAIRWPENRRLRKKGEIEMHKHGILPLVAALSIATALAGAALAQEISFSVMESGTYDVAAKQIAEEVSAAGGPKVAISAFPWAVLRQNNTTDLISGTKLYDVMSGGYYLADVYSYFQPMDDLIAADSYGDGMIPNLMTPGRSEFVDGKQIGVPYGIDAFGLLYNTEMLKAAGVEPDFATWADVIAACPKIEAATGKACISHATGSPEQIGAFFFSGYGGSYVTAAGAYALDPARATAAAEDIAALWKHLPENGNAMSFDEAHQVFRDGGVAMLATWPSFVTNSLDADGSPVAGKWGMTAFPGDGFPWLSLWQMFVPTTTKDRAAAWAWIKAYAGPQNAKRNLVEHNIGSVWTATYDDAELAATRAHFWPALTAGFAKAKNPPLSGEAQDFLTNTLQEVANGRMDAAAAIASINQTWAGIPVPPALLEAAKGSDLIAK